MPPFDRILDDHFRPAMERGMVEQLDQIAAIAGSNEPATFDNTIIALERSGGLLDRVNRVFFNLSGVDSNEARRAIAREMSPRLAAHRDAIATNPGLFARIDSLHEQREALELDAESRYLLERYHRDFVRAGARLPEAKQRRLRELNAELADLTTRFSQNVLAEVKAPEGEATLMTLSEVTTMFHEFGHALHGLFSSVTYPRFAATAVPRDFVEYPSLVNEMWALWPEVLANYARHHETGERLPQHLLERVLASRQFNEGFRTTEYLAASIIDQAWHQLKPEEVVDASDVLSFEAEALARVGIDFAPVPPRYRTPYFSQVMGGYASGYYAYMWSEVLDADTVAWFEQNGGLERANGDHFRASVLSRGGSADAMSLYSSFAGREPEIRHLLQRRRLIQAPTLVKARGDSRDRGRVQRPSFSKADAEGRNP